jgi:hypothetical protein
MLWMRFSELSSTATALFVLAVFALPAALGFIFIVYPILSPLLRALRWLNKKLLERLTGGEITANATGATVLTAALCAIGAREAPTSFSWWAAGWCWIGSVFLLTLDPGIVDSLRSWLRHVQRNKTAPAQSSKTSKREGVSPPATDQKAQKPLSPEAAPKSVAA